MTEEDLKIMIFRAEKAAFVLGKVSANIFQLAERLTGIGFTEAQPLREKLLQLRDELARDCGELYYPGTYFITKEV